MKIYQQIIQNIKPKFQKTKKLVDNPSLILDVGIANKSYQETTMIFPKSRYHGIDYIDHKIDFNIGDKFIKINLEKELHKLELEDKYDLIIVNHVLEHLPNGIEILCLLCQHLQEHGLLYAEFPSIKTAYNQKTRLNYHFHDDPTHKKFYNLIELANTALENNCAIISCGQASTPLKNILALPRALYSVLRGKGYGADMIHFLGKVDHILIRKLPTTSKY